MIEIYLITTQKILVMLFFIAIGFGMRMRGKLPDQCGKVLSVLLTNLFLPALIFNNISANFTAQTLSKHLVSLLSGVGFLAATIFAAKLLALVFGKTKADRKLYTYIFAFSNYAYFGYPIIEGVFGASMLSNTIIFAIPFTISIYTYGVHLLTSDDPDEKTRETGGIKSLLSPVIIAVAAGIICGLASIRIPKTIADILVMSSSCMSPLSMILTGFALAALPFDELFKSKISYIVSLMRLVIIPTLFGAALWVIGLKGERYIIPVIISAMPVGMNLVVFTEASNKDSKNNARICFISYFMSLMFVPLVFGALTFFK